MNVVSIDLDEIYFGFTNSKRHFISMMNCIILWMTTLFFLILFCSFDFWNYQFHLTKYYDQIKQLFLLSNVIFILVSMVKTDIFLEEHYYHLRSLKVFYYLKYDLKQMHKLNDKHYKILTVFTRLLHLCGCKIFFPLMIILSPPITFETGILKESFLIDLLLLVFYYIFILTLAITSSLFPLFLIMSFYYKFKGDQINESIRSIANSDSIPSIQLLHLIDEHNLHTIEVHRLNLTVRRSMAVFFVTSAIIEDMFIYLAIYSNNIIHKIVFSFFAIGYFFLDLLFVT